MRATYSGDKSTSANYFKSTSRQVNASGCILTSTCYVQVLGNKKKCTCHGCTNSSITISVLSSCISTCYDIQIVCLNFNYLQGFGFDMPMCISGDLLSNINMQRNVRHLLPHTSYLTVSIVEFCLNMLSKFRSLTNVMHLMQLLRTLRTTEW